MEKIVLHIGQPPKCHHLQVARINMLGLGSQRVYTIAMLYIELAIVIVLILINVQFEKLDSLFTEWRRCFKAEGYPPHLPTQIN